MSSFKDAASITVLGGGAVGLWAGWKWWAPMIGFTADSLSGIIAHVLVLLPSTALLGVIIASAVGASISSKKDASIAAPAAAMAAVFPLAIMALQYILAPYVHPLVTVDWLAAVVLGWGVGLIASTVLSLTIGLDIAAIAQ